MNGDSFGTALTSQLTLPAQPERPSGRWRAASRPPSRRRPSGTRSASCSSLSQRQNVLHAKQLPARMPRQSPAASWGSAASTRARASPSRSRRRGPRFPASPRLRRRTAARASGGNDGAASLRAHHTIPCSTNDERRARMGLASRPCCCWSPGGRSRKLGAATPAGSDRAEGRGAGKSASGRAAAPRHSPPRRPPRG